MGKIDIKEALFIKENILNRYRIWHKKRNGSDPVRLEFNSYLSGYEELCQSFDDILGIDCGITNNSLRKLFYYSDKCEVNWFNDSTLDIFYKYFSGKSMKEYKKDDTVKLKIQMDDIFETEFCYWKDVDSECYLELTILNKVYKLIDISILDDKRMTFLILNSVHYGHTSLNELLRINANNMYVIFPLYQIAIKGGIREGWRAEYFLSQMNEKIIVPFLLEMEKDILDSQIIEKISRIKSRTITEYLKKIPPDSALYTFARQVLKQLTTNE